PEPIDPVVGLDVAPVAPSPVLQPHDADGAAVSADADRLRDDEASLDHITSGPFATETMAGLLAAQGHTDQAIALYERLTAERPGDVALRARLHALRGEPAMPAATDAERGALLAAAFADPFADVSFEQFFVGAIDTGAATPAPRAAEPVAEMVTGSADREPDAAHDADDADEYAADPGGIDDHDLARFDAWLREVAT
ncbi:MAG TPA: tetratricopeptide repeat protein, partial [Gemmatirosa sp.]